jgi:hypothetical protein
VAERRLGAAVAPYMNRETDLCKNLTDVFLLAMSDRLPGLLRFDCDQREQGYWSSGLTAPAGGPRATAVPAVATIR